MYPNKITEEYIVNLEDNPTAHATIYFVNGAFSHCDYRVSRATYTYKDWMFLKNVAEAIERIIEEKGKKA